MTPVHIVEADLQTPAHAGAVVALVDAYSQDPMGDAQPLPDAVKTALVPGLRAHGNAWVFLAYAGERPVGVAVCFVGFSTFTARPVVNVHDLAVLPEARGAGVGARLLEAVADKARARGACKLTLEVLEPNLRARRLYERMGFTAPTYAGAQVNSLFLTKPL